MYLNQRLSMKNFLLSLCVYSLFLTTPAYLVADSKEAGIQTAAYVKTGIDILSYPIAMLSVAAVVGGALKGTFTSDFIDADLSKIIAFGTGLGVGALVGMGFRAFYIKAHKLMGFTDAEIAEICKESYAQQLWILAQAGSVAWIIAEWNSNAKKKAKKKNNRACVYTVFDY
jgi:hypothetical protein